MWEVGCQGTRGKKGTQERGFFPNGELERALGQGDRGEMVSVDALDPDDVQPTGCGDEMHTGRRGKASCLSWSTCQNVGSIS